MPLFLITAAVIVAILLITAMFLASRYKRCPSNKVLVVFGRSSGENKSARCYFGGGAFVWPVVQDFGYMSLAPITQQIELKDATTMQTVLVNINANFTFAIENDPDGAMAAAERLLGLSTEDVKNIASEIIVGQLRQAVGTMTVPELINGRDKFLSEVHENVAKELRKVGLHLINANIEKIKDSQGYIDALGKSETARVVNEAKVNVAEQERIGAHGVSTAERLKAITVAENQAQAVQGEKIAEAQTRILVQEQEALAATGENESAAKVAESVSTRNIREAEAKRASAIATAEAERLTADAQSAASLAKLRATEVVSVRIQKEKAELDAEKDANLMAIAAEAHARQTRITADAEKTSVELAAQARAMSISLEQGARAEGELKMLEAHAEGEKKMLQARADGIKAVVDACNGDAASASQLLVIEKLPDLFGYMAQAVGSIKIDKLTVIQGGEGSESEGGLASVYQNAVKIMPPLHAWAEAAGIKLPAFLGPVAEPTAQVADKDV